MNKEEMWNLLIDMGIATNEEIDLVTSIIGYTEQAMLDILYTRTGLQSFEQIEIEID